MIRRAIWLCCREQIFVRDKCRRGSKGVYERLITANPPHMSPVEHQAMAVPGDKFYANFRGWRQHRWELEQRKGK